VSRVALYGGFLITTAVSSVQLLIAQNVMQGLASRGAVQLLSSDSAVLDLGENRKDLPCTVTSVKPMLGFDLRFHSGNEITVT
jgi:hypothetical protein